MKRIERQHLKSRPLAEFVAATTQAVDARRRQVLLISTAVAVVLVVVIGYVTWQSRIQTRAQTLLAEAMAVEDAQVGPPPAEAAEGTPQGPTFATQREKHEAALAKFRAVAEQFPSTDAGVFAQYRIGAALMALGQPGEAAAAYQRAIDGAGDGLYGQMARLGLAESQARQGRFDEAIAAFKEMAERADGPLPVDGLLMHLGRTYLEAGKTSDAQQTFDRLLRDFPNSPYTSEAQRELDELKKT